MAAMVDNPDLDWLERDRQIIKGLGHLGVQVVSVNLYTLLLPGITNVTDRARYYSFYPWVLDRYARSGPTQRGRIEWLNWIRRFDFAFCMASVAHEIASGTFDAAATAVVGADTARRLLRGVRENSVIDVRSAADLGVSGRVPKKNAYFQNNEGGLGQYYKGSLRDLGLIATDSDYQYPDFQLTSYAGLRVTESLASNAAFKEFLDLATSGKARFSELASLGRRVSPSAIKQQSNEETLLRKLFVANDDDLCRAQELSSRVWRRALIRLVLSYVRDSEFVEGAFDYEFRWACLAGALPDGRPWALQESLRSVVSAWGAYQRNDVLNHALECLFWVVLRRLDEKPFTLKQITNYVADSACAGIPASNGNLSLAAINGTVSNWIDSCRRPMRKNKEDPWDDTSTRSWAENLEAALEDENDAAVAGWAARVLGRIVSDRGSFEKHPFENLPQAVELASTHEINLHNWFDRVKTRASEPAHAFIEELVLEWVVFRHLRVATRKLASQGVSTFKLRPEEGLLVLAAEDIPDPTFTSPRIRQAHRILGDLHLLDLSKDGTRISTEGKRLLENLS
jgi:hypothetical protein